MSEEIVKRYVVLRFGNGWIVWDNYKFRIADGVYYNEWGRDTAIEIARTANDDPKWMDREWMDRPTNFKDVV